MKALPVFLFLAAIINGILADPAGNVQQINQACLAESRVSDAELRDFFMNGMRPSDAKESIKCHMKCMMEKTGDMKNGIFDETNILNSLRQLPQYKERFAEIEQNVRQCKNEKGANTCDTAYKIQMCLANLRV